MLGSDFAGTDAIDWNMSFREGGEQEQIAAQEAIGRRYLQPSDSLFYDGSYGLDLRTFIADVIPIPVAKGMILAEALKDERCTDCAVEITLRNPPGEPEEWLIEISPVLSSAESFSLTFVATAQSVEQLNVNV